MDLDNRFLLADTGRVGRFAAALYADPDNTALLPAGVECAIFYCSKECFEVQPPAMDERAN
ncbi:MAG TPA: hypothetical protein VFT89_08580, partial [Rhizobiaceae bacterium]|nr:hypothetical protein [Rhizobiaceae bacterium]